MNNTQLCHVLGIWKIHEASFEIIAYWNCQICFLAYLRSEYHGGHGDNISPKVEKKTFSASYDCFVFLLHLKNCL